MKIFCIAEIRNPLQRENLCYCLRLVGGDPESNDEAVSLTYEGNADTCEVMISLFEHYPVHGIYTEDPPIEDNLP